MREFHPKDRATEPVDPATFTGPGTLERMPDLCSTLAVNGYRVRFEAGTRTAWHAHSGPQILLVTEGRCRFQRRGGPVREIADGGIVTFDPDEEHWHGASADGPMTHVALNVAPDADSQAQAQTRAQAHAQTPATTRWLEKVSDEAYGALASDQD